MSYLRWALVSVGVVGLLGTACSAAKNTGQAVSSGTKEVADQVSGEVTDASITAAIKMKMADDPLIGAFDIDIDTEDSRVTLSGTVTSASEADKSVELARSVNGVRNVASHLVIS